MVYQKQQLLFYHNSSKKQKLSIWAITLYIKSVEKNCFIKLSLMGKRKKTFFFFFFVLSVIGLLTCPTCRGNTDILYILFVKQGKNYNYFQIHTKKIQLYSLYLSKSNSVFICPYSSLRCPECPTGSSNEFPLLINVHFRILF